MDGNPVSMHGVDQDITVQKRAEKTLRERTSQFERMIHLAPAMFHTYDPAVGGLSHSPEVESVLRYSHDDLRKNPKLWHDSIHSDDLSAVDDAIVRAACASSR